MSLIDKVWYKKLGAKNAPVVLPLLPFSALFSVVTRLRRKKYKNPKYSLKVKPVVIVVGGIAVGGTGKTPLCISLIQKLSSLGYNVGLLSRGYKGHSENYPLTVQPTSDVRECGDEPLLIKLSVRDDAVVVVDPNRERGASFLEHLGVDVIITDDGMQHYSLMRDIEIAVVDGKRLLGNGFLMPAGPLREGAWRLKTVDYVISNGTPSDMSAFAGINFKSMHLVPTPAITLSSFCSNKGFRDYLQKGSRIVAMAGIGNPERFYNTLRDFGYIVADTIEVGDHGLVDKKTLEFNAKSLPVVMTSKDAVKYASYGIENLFVLNVEAMLPESFYQDISSRLYDLTNQDEENENE